MAKALVWDSGELGSVPDSATDLLADLEQDTVPQFPICKIRILVSFVKHSGSGGSKALYNK